MLQLDLNNLTPQHLEQCKPYLGRCNYTSPCIIGTLIPEKDRRRLDNKRDQISRKHPSKFIPKQPSIGQLIDVGEVSFPNLIQQKAAEELQDRFDNGTWDEVLEIAAPYLEKANVG
jgi:hypothetical protein